MPSVMKFGDHSRDISYGCINVQERGTPSGGQVLNLGGGPPELFYQSDTYEQVNIFFMVCVCIYMLPSFH